MRKLFLLSVLIVLFSCGKDGIIKVIDPNGEENGYFIGTDTTLEVVTWNLKEFPYNGNTTVNLLADIIDSLDYDLIAFQEVIGSTEYYQLTNQLDGYSSYRANSAYGGMNLAYLYKDEVITPDSIFEIYTDDSDAFPRPPLVMKFHYNSMPYVVINNHFKAYTDSVSVERRREASRKLKEYCDANLPYDNIFIVGDMNDSLTDTMSVNVFWNFLTDNQYQATDMGIAEGNTTGWSYFGLSHLDHIFVSNELFDEFDNEGTKTITLKIENMLEGGESDYRSNISDHRPVGCKIYF